MISRASLNAAPAAGVVLAAGSSRRFGAESKLLAEIGGEPVIRRTVRAVLDADLQVVILVLGHHSQAVAEALEPLDEPAERLRYVLNPHHATGQSSSVRAALAAVPETAGAAVFVPGDQPLLSTRTLDRMVGAWRAGATIAVARYRERRGAPTLFDRRYFSELDDLRGDTGGRALLARHQSSVQTVQVASSHELDDVDTPEDLRNLREVIA